MAIQSNSEQINQTKDIESEVDSGFTQHSQVINGYSDFMVEIFGEKGRHARSAVGMNSLPVNLAVEIEVIVEIEGN